MTFFFYHLSFLHLGVSVYNQIHYIGNKPNCFKLTEQTSAQWQCLAQGSVRISCHGAVGELTVFQNKIK